MMKKYQVLWVVLAIALGAGWAQSQSGQPAADSGQAQATPPVPGYGQDTPAPQSSANPPITGLDQPSLEPPLVRRSYLQFGAHVSEAVDTNLSDSTSSGSDIHGVTRALGSVTLQRLWRKYDFSLDYVGGGVFYGTENRTATQVHTLDAEQRILWRTGQLAIRDSFTYLPEGSFGYGSYGGSGTLGGIGGLGGIGLGGAVGGISGNPFFGPGQFAALGQESRITNVTTADVTQSLNARSSVTLAGSYGLVHFIDDTLGFINSRQISVQAGYNYQLTRRDQIAFQYGFQAFRYPSNVQSDIDSHLWQVLWGHRISGRMDLILGGGPELTEIHNSIFGDSSRISASGRASLRYRFPQTSVELTYDHNNTSGSGFFAGAETDVARLSLSRPLGRLWEVSADAGFSHNRRLTPTVVGLAAQSYNYFYAGGALRRQLGRNFSAYVSYQYNNLEFDDSFCGTSPGCSTSANRHVAIIGLDWHPRPIRLD